jgi:hypothetical protein
MKSITIGSPLRVDSGCCPSCGARLTGVTPIDGRIGPKAGDASVCFYCAAVLVFEADLSLRCALPEERTTMLQDQTLAAVHKAAVEIIAQRKRGTR